MRQLNNLFNPKSIAILGASSRKGSVGNTIANNLKDYKGSIYYVNPSLKGKKLFSKKTYSTVLDIKENIDLAIIAVPSKAAVPVIKELVIKKCKNVIVITAGFNEIGNNNLTNEFMAVVHKNKINMVGPNCLGFLNLDNNLDATFNSKEKLLKPSFGNVSIISQSGALGIALLDLANYENLKINKFISYGNALDVTETDLLEYLGKDKKTDVILAYIEGVNKGKHFFEVLKKVSKTKKVIILKGGTSTQGNKAAKSHTAAIAGSSKVFSSVVRQAGGIVVDSIKEMFNLAKLFSIYKNNEIKNIQIITNGGGFGVLTTDQLEKNNIKLANPSKTTKDKILKLVPNYAVVKNPLDLTGDADNLRFKKVIDICLKDKNISAIAVLLLFQLPAIDEKIVDVITNLNNNKKPIFVLTIGGKPTREIIKKLENKNVICFIDPKELAQTIKFNL